MKVVGGEISSLPGISDAIEVPYSCFFLVHTLNYELINVKLPMKHVCLSRELFVMLLKTLWHGLCVKLFQYYLEIIGTLCATIKHTIWSYCVSRIIVTVILLSVGNNLSDLELKPVGTLEVKLVQARDLTNKDLVGKSDPFAILYIRPLRDRMKTSKIIVSLQRNFFSFLMWGF